MRYLKRSAKPSSDNLRLGEGRIERDERVSVDRDVGTAEMGVGVVGVVGDMRCMGDVRDVDNEGDTGDVADVDECEICDAGDATDVGNVGQGDAEAGGVVAEVSESGERTGDCPSGPDKPVTTSSSEGGRTVSSSSR